MTLSLSKLLTLIISLFFPFVEVGNILPSFSEELTEVYTSDTIHYYWKMYIDRRDNMNNIPQVKHFHQNKTLFKKKRNLYTRKRCWVEKKLKSKRPTIQKIEGGW